MSAKDKGRRTEYKVRDCLEAAGWYVVKAGGSLGIWDLVCLHPDFGVKLIQVKSNRWRGSREDPALIGFQCHPSWTKEVWMWKDRAKEPEICFV